MHIGNLYLTHTSNLLKLQNFIVIQNLNKKLQKILQSLINDIMSGECVESFFRRLSALVFNSSVLAEVGNTISSGISKC